MDVNQDEDPFAGHETYWIGGGSIGCLRCDTKWERVGEEIIVTEGERSCSERRTK